MDRIAELLGQRRVGIVWPQIRVVRLVAIRAPETFDRAGVHIDHGDALVAVTIGDVGLTGLGVEGDFRHAPEMRRVVTGHGLLRLAILLQELAVVRELENVRVSDTVAADPDVVLVVDGNAVIG